MNQRIDREKKGVVRMQDFRAAFKLQKAASGGSAAVLQRSASKVITNRIELLELCSLWDQEKTGEIGLGDLKKSIHTVLGSEVADSNWIDTIIKNNDSTNAKQKVDYRQFLSSFTVQFSEEK
eukprot:TRINITY_DN13032_c0_g1_i1.p1 TRINITY_DN13032_c0_g1~~TRINITY_DN13032_c0_g1_i1.p1  ORF type:complete len:122 (-),score=35.62 TRINITY_DN13032_c0_g1_i1:179-544(-)